MVPVASSLLSNIASDPPESFFSLLRRSPFLLVSFSVYRTLRSPTLACPVKPVAPTAPTARVHHVRDIVYEPGFENETEDDVDNDCAEDDPLEGRVERDEAVDGERWEVRSADRRIDLA